MTKLPPGMTYCGHCRSIISEEEYADHIETMIKEAAARAERGGVFVTVDGDEMWAPTVEEFKAEGFKVILRHYRFVQPDRAIQRSRLLREIASGAIWTRGPATKGGGTHVVLLAPDGHWSEGYAHCSRQDVFSKKAGYALAVNRALSNLSGQTYQFDKRGGYDGNSESEEGGAPGKDPSQSG